MSYSKQNFKSGDMLYATQLNAMDDQVAKNEGDVESLKAITDDLAEASFRKKLPVELGGYTVYNKRMFDVENTIRARTKICSAAEYGRYVAVELPANISINQVATCDGTDWAATAPSGLEYEFGSGVTQFRFSFLKGNGTAEITDSDLAGIKLISSAAMITNWYSGKKYAALGDSITYGFVPWNYTYASEQLDSFAKLAAEKLGMTFVNYGYSGNTVAAVEGLSSPMSERYANMPDDADLITVMGGTNDIRQNVQLGTMSDRTNTTFYGALHVLLGGLYKKYFIDQNTTVGKGKKVVVLTPIKLLQSSGGTSGGTGTLVDMSAWVAAIKEVAAYYSFPVLDMYNLSNINPHLNQTVQGMETGYTGYYNPYITDGTHPTQEGAEIMANVLVGFLRSIA